MRLATSSLGLVLLLAGTAVADPATFYPGGLMSFSYQQIPFGLNGSFHSEGTITDPAAFPAGGDGATTALYAETDGSAYLLVAGGTFNADRTVDAGFLFLRGPAPLTPGSYPLDPAGYTALYGFVDDATGVTLPDDITTTDFDTWVNAIQAAHKFWGTIGTIQLTVADPAQLQGMFSVTALDLTSGLPILVPDGIFSLGTTVSVESETWGAIKAAYAE